MKFFIPNVKSAQLEAHYADLVAVVKDKMRWDILPRRIYRLEHIHDKRKQVFQVGEKDAMGMGYDVCAILEASSYIIVTTDAKGRPGVTIMVDKKEVIAEEDFESVPTAA